MILEKQDAVYAATKIMEYFNDFNRIDDYFRARKIERVKNIPTPLPGMGLEDDMFQDFNIHPEDMNFSIVQLQSQTFDTMLELVASFSPDNSPGKEMKLGIKETNTNTIVGFIKLGSPLINSKPRNNWLGGTPNLEIFNKRAMMGMILIPVQPAFGYNMLGLKLLAMIMCSHEVCKMFNDKYDIDLAIGETTSLYGSEKKDRGSAVSAYDGLKPWLKYLGDTESKFLLTLGEDIYFEMRDFFNEKNDGVDLVHKGASSRKLKLTTAWIGVIKKSLRQHDEKAYRIFCDAMDKATGITTTKRFFHSTLGFANSREVLLGETDVLEKAVNYDRFSMESILEKWRKMAGKRYEKLIAENRLRRDLEFWSVASGDLNKIDIIR